MRTKMTTAGVIVLAALTLAGCSGTADTATEKTESTSTPAAKGNAPAKDEAPGDCPELKVGATVESETLGACASEQLGTVSGYASTGSSMGMETTAKYNDGGTSVEMTIASMGSMIVIDDEAWVQPAGGQWSVADAASADPIIAGLSTASQNVSASNIAAIMTSLSGELTVTGTDTRLGEDVFVLTGEQSSGGTKAQSTYYVTSDWAPLESEQIMDMNGSEMKSTTVVTEWDKKQDIQAPL